MAYDLSDHWILPFLSVKYEFLLTTKSWVTCVPVMPLLHLGTYVCQVSNQWSFQILMFGETDAYLYSLRAYLTPIETVGTNLYRWAILRYMRQRRSISRAELIQFCGIVSKNLVSLCFCPEKKGSTDLSVGTSYGIIFFNWGCFLSHNPRLC